MLKRVAAGFPNFDDEFAPNGFRRICTNCRRWSRLLRETSNLPVGRVVVGLRERRNERNVLTFKNLPEYHHSQPLIKRGENKEKIAQILIVGIRRQFLKKTHKISQNFFK